MALTGAWARMARVVAWPVDAVGERFFLSTRGAKSRLFSWSSRPHARMGVIGE
jgi:hypothetical protein